MCVCRYCENLNSELPTKRNNCITYQFQGLGKELPQQKEINCKLFS